MTGTDRTEIAVIGAGVVGLAIAFRLVRDGHEVIIIDPNEPGSGASYGNAGTIADYAVMPVGTPEVLRNLPSLLFDRTSPLAIRRAGLLALAPWLLRFAVQSLPRPAAQNAAAIAALVADATPRWRELVGEISAAQFLQARGCVYLYETEQEFTNAGSDMLQRRAHGIIVDRLDSAELAALEPGLPPMAGAAFFPSAVFLSDPGRVVGLLGSAAVTAGVRVIRAGVTRLVRERGQVTILGDGLHLTARRVVIAAGAHSKPLARMAGDRVPLDTERGYHVEYDMDAPRLTRPCCPTARGFYLCPMAGRLRVAGTVELGGLTAPPSPHRITLLEQGARAIFPDLPAPNRIWMGFRPSMPDSLPVIGPSSAGSEVLHAYGHGHIGLTLAPITAAIIADLIAGRAPGIGIKAYLPTRFG